MPFVSEKQRRLCWYMYNKAKKEHRKPKWDCHKWAHSTSKRKKLPLYKRRRRRRSRPIKHRTIKPRTRRHRVRRYRKKRSNNRLRR